MKSDRLLSLQVFTLSEQRSSHSANDVMVFNQNSSSFSPKISDFYNIFFSIISLLVVLNTCWNEIAELCSTLSSLLAAVQSTVKDTVAKVVDWSLQCHKGYWFDSLAPAVNVSMCSKTAPITVFKCWPILNMHIFVVSEKLILTWDIYAPFPTVLFFCAEPDHATPWRAANGC